MKHAKLKRFFGIFKERFIGAEVSNTSVLIAYYLLLSLFPLLIAIGNILPYFHIDPSVALEYIDLAVPPPVQQVLDPIIERLLTSSNGGLLSIAALGAIWSASKGITYLQKGIDKAYGIPKAASYVARRLVSVLTILLILLLLVAFVLVFSLGEMLLDAIAPTVPVAEAILGVILSLKWPVALLFIFALMVLVYRVTPDVKVRLRDTLPGALLATAGLLLLVQGFTIYIRFATRSFSSYGALGAFFVLMFWLNFSMMIVMLGAVLNATAAEYKTGPAEPLVGRVDVVIERTRRSLGGFLARKREAGGEGKKLEAFSERIEEILEVETPATPNTEDPPPKDSAENGAPAEKDR